MLSAYITELHGEISSQAWGFARLSDLADVEQRALVSDQLLSAAQGLLDGLVDAAISVHEHSRLTGPNGSPYPRATDSLNDVMRQEQLRHAVAGFFDAFGTTLDCLAAVLVVVARVPLSVQRADFTRLSTVDPAAAHGKAFPAPVPVAQRKLWEALGRELIEARQVIGARDWLEWALEMRNALTHRGRVTNVFLPRGISGRLLVPPTESPQELYRYDLHLRRRPWLPEIEGMLAGHGLVDSWLDEPSIRTLRGLLDALVSYVERLIAWASAQWRIDSPGMIAPVHRWTLPETPPVAFAGIAPGDTTPIQGAIGGINTEHLRLAERLRLRRAGTGQPS